MNTAFTEFETIDDAEYERRARTVLENVEATVDRFLQEDVIDILLNIKNIAIRLNAREEATLRLEKSGNGPVTAADIQRVTRDGHRSQSPRSRDVLHPEPTKSVRAALSH